MEGIRITVDDDQSDASSLTAAGVLRRIEERRAFNREMLENFMGVRPIKMRRHASMRTSQNPKIKSETIIEEDDFLASDDVRDDAPEDNVYRHFDYRYDDWSMSVPTLDRNPIESNESWSVASIATESRGEKKAPKRSTRKGRLSSLACVRCVVGAPEPGKAEESEEGKDQESSPDNSIVTTEELFGESEEQPEAGGTEASSKQEEGWAIPTTVYEICGKYTKPSEVETKKKESRTIELRTFECVSPCDIDSFDSDDSFHYELSDGSIADEDDDDDNDEPDNPTPK